MPLRWQTCQAAISRSYKAAPVVGLWDLAEPGQCLFADGSSGGQQAAASSPFWALWGYRVKASLVPEWA